MKSKTIITSIFGALLLALVIPFAGNSFVSAEQITIDEVEKMRTNDGIAYDRDVTDELEKVTSRTGTWIEHDILGNGETMTIQYNVKALDNGQFDVTTTVSAFDPTDKTQKSSTANYIVEVLDEETFNVDIPYYNVDQKFKKGGVSAQTHITMNPKDTGYMPTGQFEAITLTETINGCWDAIYKVYGSLYWNYSTDLTWTADSWYWGSCIVPYGFDDADIYLNAQSNTNQGKTGTWTPTLPLIPDTYTYEADFFY